VFVAPSPADPIHHRHVRRAFPTGCAFESTLWLCSHPAACGVGGRGNSARLCRECASRIRAVAGGVCSAGSGRICWAGRGAARVPWRGRARAGLGVGRPAILRSPLPPRDGRVFDCGRGCARTRGRDQRGPPGRPPHDGGSADRHGRHWRGGLADDDDAPGIRAGVWARGRLVWAWGDGLLPRGWLRPASIDAALLGADANARAHAHAHCRVRRRVARSGPFPPSGCGSTGPTGATAWPHGARRRPRHSCEFRAAPPSWRRLGIPPVGARQVCRCDATRHAGPALRGDTSRSECACSRGAGRGKRAGLRGGFSARGETGRLAGGFGARGETGRLAGGFGARGETGRLPGGFGARGETGRLPCGLVAARAETGRFAGRFSARPRASSLAGRSPSPRPERFVSDNGSTGNGGGGRRRLCGRARFARALAWRAPTQRRVCHGRRLRGEQGPRSAERAGFGGGGVQSRVRAAARAEPAGLWSSDVCRQLAAGLFARGLARFCRTPQRPEGPDRHRQIWVCLCHLHQRCRLDEDAESPPGSVVSRSLAQLRAGDFPRFRRARPPPAHHWRAQGDDVAAVEGLCRPSRHHHPRANSRA
jgi:hypothetical protein